MENDNYTADTGDGQNFKTHEKVIVPPTLAETPIASPTNSQSSTVDPFAAAKRLNAAAIYNDWHTPIDKEQPAANNHSAPNNGQPAAVANNTNSTSPTHTAASPATADFANPGNSQNSNVANKTTLNPVMKIIVIVFGIISLCYFGFVVVMDLANWIAMLANSASNTNTASAQIHWTGAEIVSLALSIVAFCAMVMLVFASIQIIKLRESGRKLWLKAGATVGIILAVSVASLIITINSYTTTHQAESTLSTAITIEQQQVAKNLAIMETKLQSDQASGAPATQIATDESQIQLYQQDSQRLANTTQVSVNNPYISQLILSAIIPLAICGGGLILLTRKSIKNWFM